MTSSVRAAVLVAPALMLSCAIGRLPQPEPPATDQPALEHPPPPAVRSAPLAGFMRGINLGNALDAPGEGAWGVVLSPRHFELAHGAGFDHVRLPVRFAAHAAEQAPYAIDETFLRRVDWAVAQALSNQLGVIVDLHHYEALMKQPAEHAERFLGIWRQLAARYHDRPGAVAFELVNEPNGRLDSPTLNALVARVLPIVRAQNPDRLVLVDSRDWGSAKYLSELTLPENDANVVATFHEYQPLLFTHQGAEWMGPEYQTLGVVFPGAGHMRVRAVLDDLDHATRYVQQSGRRVYLGEFGAIDRADAASRERWVRFVREEAERRGFGWAYWDDGGHFRAMDVNRGAWNDYLLSALLH